MSAPLRTQRIELGYDRDCGFCWTWVDRFRRRLLRHERVDLVELTDAELEESFTWRVWLHRADGSVQEYQYGDAMLELLSLRYPWLTWLFRLAPVRWLANLLYRMVAEHRAFFCRVMTCHPPPRETPAGAHP